MSMLEGEGGKACTRDSGRVWSVTLRSRMEQKEEEAGGRDGGVRKNEECVCLGEGEIK